MSDPTHDLERLISRHLDDESTPQQRRELNDQIARDPESAALFEEYAALDREVKQALRSALHHRPVKPKALPGWERTARVFVLAAAACLAVMFWFKPSDQVVSPNDPSQASSQLRSWFAEPPDTGDVFVEHPERFNRPIDWVGKRESEWIVVPSEVPGEFLVIQIDRIKTGSNSTQQDF